MTDPGEESRTRPCVFVVDDDETLLASVGALLSASEVVYELFASGEALLTRLKGDERGCIILDYAMPGANGLDVLKALRARGHLLPVIMITAHGDIGIAVRAMKAGASDFIEKPWARDSLLQAIDQAMRADLDRQVVREAESWARKVIASFTPRERDVFGGLISGASNKQIAQNLDLSPRTVEFYRANVLEKAQTSSVAGLVRLAFAAGEVDI